MQKSLRLAKLKRELARQYWRTIRLRFSEAKGPHLRQHVAV